MDRLKILISCLMKIARRLKLYFTKHNIFTLLYQTQLIMKKIFIVLLVFLSIICLQFCKTTKNSTAKSKTNPPSITYIGNVQAIVSVNCSPCHFPPKGSKKPLNTYAAVSGDIDDIISRIQRDPGDDGFMPARHPKLADSTIQVFVQWRKEGLAEK